MTSFPILPVSSSEYQVNPPFIVDMETHHPRLRVNSSGHFISYGQLQSDDITTVPHLISSSEFTDELSVSLKINSKTILALAKAFVKTLKVYLCVLVCISQMTHKHHLYQ